MRKRIAAILLPLLTGTVAVGLQNSKAKTADSGTAQPKSGSVGQLLMQIERDWWKAIIGRNIAKIREIVAPDVVLTTPDGSVQSLDDDVAELKSGSFHRGVVRFLRYEGKALWPLCCGDRQNETER